MELPSNKSVEIWVQAPQCHDAPLILSYLNEDCWRPVLDYLRLEDIVRSERVSRRWQRVVLGYLQGNRNVPDLKIWFQVPQCHYAPLILRYLNEDCWRPVLDYLQGIRIRLQYRRFRHGETRGHNCRTLTLDDASPALFEKITSKLGALVIASDCINRNSFWSIAKNCHYIESVTISGKIETQLMRSQIVDFKRLKRLTFNRCRFSGVLQGKDYHADLPDYCIKKFLESVTLEELKISNNTQVTGRCLSALKHNLKSLCFINCPNLDFDAILENVNHLSEVTKLELNGNQLEILQKVHLLLDKMPKLEHLSLSRYQETDLPGSVVESISKLDRLRHLCVKENQNVTDEWLQAVARGCKKLQTVDVGSCREKRGPIGRRSIIWVTPEGVLALCKALSSSLLVLSVAYNHNLSNEDVAEFISACPNLTVLDLQGCGQLSWYLIDKAERAARGRPQQLRLRLYTSLPGATGEVERHGTLLLDFDPREWRLPEDY